APERRRSGEEKGPNRGLRGDPDKKSFSCERLSGSTESRPTKCVLARRTKEVLAVACLFRRLAENFFCSAKESRWRGANDGTRGRVRSPEEECRDLTTALAAAPPRFAQRSGYNQNAMETFQSQLTRKLCEALAAAGFPPAGEVAPATDPRFGDYQSNAALLLGKQRGENPRKIAEAIVANLDVTEVSERPNVAGAGFLH